MKNSATTVGGIILMFEMFKYQFFIFATIAGLAIGITTALLSNFLVLKNQSLIGDGLAHVSFTGIIIGMALVNEPIYIAIPIAIIASVLIKMLMNSSKVRGDAAIGLVSSLSLAAGFIIISVGTGYNRSIEGLLVGSILTVNTIDIILSLFLLVSVTIYIVFSYQSLFSLTYDYEYARFTRINVKLYDYILSIITAITIVVGVQSVGILLISSLVIFPAISANQLAKSFKESIFISVIINVIAVFFGLYFAHILNIPSGSSIVMLHGIIFVFTLIIKFLKRN
jgi:zinc transport system permease protein